MGYTGYRARNIARHNRPVKRGTGTEELIPRWIGELEANGWGVERLTASLVHARHQCRGLARPLTDGEIDRLAADLFDPEGEFLARWKVFGRARLVAEIAPRLYGHHPGELDRVVDRILASELVVPLIGVAGACEQPYATTAVLATEHTIAGTLERVTTRRGPVAEPALIDHVTRAKQTELGHPLSAGQRRAVARVCGSGRAIDVIVGVAESPLPARRSTASTSTTATPSPSTESKAPPPIAPTTWPRAAAASSPTSRCPGPTALASCTPSPTISTSPSRTSLTTGRSTATSNGSPAPPPWASIPPSRPCPTTSRDAADGPPPSSTHSNATPHPT
jgi:hypothetical protein